MITLKDTTDRAKASVTTVAATANTKTRIRAPSITPI
jgi:hypothetical protein